jgi:hypothetical protein
MQQQESIKLHRHDAANEVSVHLEVHMVKPHLKPQARKLVELLVYDLEDKLFGDNQHE